MDDIFAINTFSTIQAVCREVERGVFHSIQSENDQLASALDRESEELTSKPFINGSEFKCSKEEIGFRIELLG